MTISRRTAVTGLLGASLSTASAVGASDASAANSVPFAERVYRQLRSQDGAAWDEDSAFAYSTAWPPADVAWDCSSLMRWAHARAANSSRLLLPRTASGQRYSAAYVRAKHIRVPIHQAHNFATRFDVLYFHNSVGINHTAMSEGGENFYGANGWVLPDGHVCTSNFTFYSQYYSHVTIASWIDRWAPKPSAAKKVTRSR